MVVVVMGVAGSGKSSVGRLLADRLGADFVEGDDHHPPGNVRKMRAGQPLTDADREPWLEALARELDAHSRSGRDVVLACSALKRRYRRALLEGREDARLVHLEGPRELIAARMAARRDHFFPPGLLESQLEALEPPEPDEAALVVDAAQPPDAIAADVARALGR